MRLPPVFIVLFVVCSANGSESDERAKKLLQGENYTVTWGAASVYDPNAVLEIGDGNGHGGTLGWLRFQPGKEGVEVLAVEFDGGRQSYKSKWPPDRAPVTVKRALLKTDTYVSLLRTLAVVDAANLTAMAGNQYTSSSNDFWVNARLTTADRTLVDLDWAGYKGSLAEIEFAKPRAAARLARELIMGLDFKDHTLTREERAWASEKFARDWKKFKGHDFHWWVRERYIKTIGVVGDEAALSVMRQILAAEPTKGKAREASEERCVYYAINAVTRLTKEDVRDKPVEQMDIEKTRLKVLELIKHWK